MRRLFYRINIRLPFIPDYATNNGHMFYLVCKSADQRNQIISHLKEKGVYAVFHYLSLHKSDFYKEKYFGKELLNADYYTDGILRLPFYYELSDNDIQYICENIRRFQLSKIKF